MNAPPVAGATASLGIIPSWQFSDDPAVNPVTWNPHLKIPEGMSQSSIQPFHPDIPQSGDANLQGLGITMANWMQPAAAGAGISGVFDSFWWTHRKWIAIGAISLLGIGIALFATKVLR